MPETIKEQELDAGHSTHSCDTAYDAGEDFKLLFDHKLDPNIGQRPPGKNPEKPKKSMPNRVKGAEVLDTAEYAKRDMIEAYSGQRWPYSLPVHERKHAQAWHGSRHTEALNRLRCAKEPGTHMPPYPNRRTRDVIPQPIKVPVPAL